MAGVRRLGEGEDDAGVAQRLGDAAAVRADDGDAVDHRLDGDEGLILPPERRQQAGPRDAPELPRVGRVAHQEDVAVLAEVEPAVGQRPLRAPPLDGQDRDIGPVPAQLVGDPGEGIDPLLVRRVDDGQVTRVAVLDPDAAEVDQVGQDGAFQAECLPVVIGGESRRNDHGVGAVESPGIAVAEVVQREDDGRAQAPGPRANLARQPAASIADQDIGLEPPQCRIVKPEDILVAVVPRLGAAGRGAAGERDRDASDRQAVMGRHVGTEPVRIGRPGLALDHLERDAEPREPGVGIDLAAVLEEQPGERLRGEPVARQRLHHGPARDRGAVGAVQVAAVGHEEDSTHARSVGVSRRACPRPGWGIRAGVGPVSQPQDESNYGCMGRGK